METHFRNSPMQLENLERRELFSAVVSPVVEPLTPTSAIVAHPAVTSALDGTYSGVANITLGKGIVDNAVKVKVSNNGTLLTGSLVLSKYYTFKINVATTFVKT